MNLFFIWPNKLDRIELENCKETMQKNYNVVIIGGGVSGLTLGAMLGKLGQKCCIIEKEKQAGGYIAGYQRKGFHFDTAIHWLNQFGENGISHRCFSFIGDDYPRPRPLSRINYYYSDNHKILLQPDLELVKADFISLFPDEEKGIRRFFYHAEQLSHMSLKMSNYVRSSETMSFFGKLSFYLRVMPIVLPILKHIRYSGDKGVKKGLSKYFKGDAIKDVFGSESDLLSCLFPFAWAKNNDYFSTPAGGSAEFVKWLLAKNKMFGNDILLNTESRSVILEGEKAIGVKAVQKTKQLQLNAKYIVAASDLNSLYRDLLPKGKISEKVLQRLRNSKQYKSAFTVSVALDCPAEDLGFGEELISLMKNNLERYQHEDSNPGHSKLNILSPSVRDKSLCPEEYGIVTIYMAADIESYDYWKTEVSPEGRRIRGGGYYGLKKEIAQKLFQRLDNEINPDFSKHILFYEAATPVTYERYTSNHRGTIMGTRPGKENIKNKVASHFTEIENLLVGGQWAELGGGIPTTSLSAMNTALIVLRKENRKMFKEVIRYFGGNISLEELNDKIG